MRVRRTLKLHAHGIFLGDIILMGHSNPLERMFLRNQTFLQQLSFNIATFASIAGIENGIDSMDHTVCTQHIR